ncbi:hypothetical protein [Pseudofrankia sp. DC12]|uniref:hypothetical protein n=1 Tax=Pseudofrankia sp. DC12 TaxID=683315 RepID=UPI0005F86EC6|nr:hypothetical protein [Pseudofrankia sp. DC12]
MAGRGKEYRTWEELSGSERRRGLVILGGAGVIVVGAVVWVFGPTGGGSPDGAPRPVLAAGVAGAPVAAGSQPAAVTTSPVPDLTGFYAAIAGPRGDVTSAEAAVRKAIADLDGMALQPACVLLDSRAVDAQHVGDVPDGDVGQAWTKGLADYQQAARWCAQLFDGTQVAPETLRSNTSSSLDSADTAWASVRPATAATVEVAQAGTIAAGAGPAGLAVASPAG